MRSYFTFLSRNKAYTGIEILGLSVSMAFIILIFCHIKHEISIPTMIPGYENTYLIHLSETPHTPYDTGDQLKETIPEIADICRIHDPYDCTVTAGEFELYNINVCGMESNWADFFPTDVIDGSITDFTDVRNAIITRQLADKLFSDKESAVGQTITIEKQNYTVSGVIDPANLQIFESFNIIVNIRSALFKKLTEGKESSDNMAFLSFIKTAPGVEEELLAQKWDEYARTRWKSHFDIGWETETGVTRLDKLYFHSTSFFFIRHGSKRMLCILCAIAIGLFFSALVNYINLGVALVGKRAKEMAIRRLLGSSKHEIRFRYFKESLFLTCVCFALGIGLAYLFAPDFYQLIDARTDLLDHIDGWHVAAYLFTILLTAGLASLLPGMLVSKLQPLDVVRGTFKLKSKMIFSKIFIVMQNVLAIVLTAVTLTMHHQIEYASHRNTGLNNTDALVLVTAFSMKDELAALPCVKRIGYGYALPGLSKMKMSIHTEGKTYQFVIYSMDTTAFQIIGFDIQERYDRALNYSIWYPRSTANALNVTPEHSAVPNAIARWNLDNDAPTPQPGGVTGDILTSAIWEENTFMPTIFTVADRKDKSTQRLLIETIGPHDEAKAAIGELYARMAKTKNVPDIPEECEYLSEIPKRGLQPLRRTARLVSIFNGVALLIALLGLVAMSHYYTEQCTMEIAMRKIYGATRKQILQKLARGYFSMMLLSTVIAIPVATVICRRYLENYSYRIPGHTGELVAATAITMIVSALAVVWQISKAATANPIDTIKKE